jgi:putative NADH-flavin reductase
MNMKLLIIGGTGGTGKELINQALEAGHEVTALVRHSDRLRIANPRLKIVRGDVLLYQDVFNAVEGQDAVLSALGHKKFFLPTSILSVGTRNLIRAMETHGVKRFICITALGVGNSRFKLGIYYSLFLIPLMLLFYFLDKERQEKLIKASTLDWTIVRPAQLFNGKLRSKYKVGATVGNYFFTLLISRADVAHFMLSQLADTTWLRKSPGIAR